MKINSIESSYKVEYRKSTSESLSNHIALNHSIELIGMKRIGISNYLRFFLSNKKVYKKYFKENHQVFIVVDLNDLVEREIFAFWRLMHKRIVDAVEGSDLDKSVKDKISESFLTSIQTGDLFLTIDAIRESLKLINIEGFHPSVFFIRFDRIIDAVSKDFFNNLLGLIESTQLNLSYIFTANRRLSDLAPSVFDVSSMNAFCHPEFIKPSKLKDTELLLNSLLEKYNLKISDSLRNELKVMSGGHFQYLNYSIIVVAENQGKSDKFIINKIKIDERIELQSEEIYSSLTISEQNELISNSVIDENSYLFQTGIVAEGKIFSPLFEAYLKRKQTQHKVKQQSVLTNKENLLFEMLKINLNEICSRDKVVKEVWPEYSEYGVSDWSIDRLVARLRKKLELQKSKYKVETIRTRGFKMIVN